MAKKPKHLPFGVRFSEKKLREASDAVLEEKRNALWNRIEGFEDAIKSCSKKDKATYAFDLLEAKEMMQQLKAELNRRAAGRA